VTGAPPTATRPGDQENRPATGSAVQWTNTFDACARILWQLRNGPLRFRALQEACGGLSPTLLNVRIGELRDAALVSTGDEGYALARIGHELPESLAPLDAWARRWQGALEREAAARPRAKRSQGEER
jgi:DNA-binding HxlR family transcriptional regulator